MGSSGSGNSISHGTEDVNDISGDPSAILNDKTYTYYGNGDLETKTETMSNGTTKRTTYTWDITGNLTNSDEEFI